MEVKNRSFQYGKVALAARNQYHQLQFVLKVVAICIYVNQTRHKNVTNIMSLFVTLPAVSMLIGISYWKILFLSFIFKAGAQKPCDGFC